MIQIEPNYWPKIQEHLKKQYLAEFQQAQIQQVNNEKKSTKIVQHEPHKNTKFSLTKKTLT